MSIVAERLSPTYARYAHAVDQLRASYAAIPPGAPVRLAKSTSNLFRGRTPTADPGLDVSAFTGVLSIDADSRTADVLGMTTYEDLVDATLPTDWCRCASHSCARSRSEAP